MGKITGFMDYRRSALSVDTVEARVRNYREFERPFDDETGRFQGARCMDCGVPFCHGDTGCPVDNLIPEFNDMVFRRRWKEALQVLHSTNNFPEFTGRLCPAPCESSCVLGLIDPPVAIKSIERTIIDHGFREGWVEPKPAPRQTGKRAAIIGSGPSGLACAQQLARAGHSVVVYEKNDRIGGLLRYGIPDFKMDKLHIDRRIEQMKMEGVVFKTGVCVGKDISASQLRSENNAVILACGCEEGRDLAIPGRELKGIYLALEFLIPQNRVNAGDKVNDQIIASGKDVIVIGGGDTGSDCVGTSNRHRAKSVTQIEIFEEPPRERSDSTPWPMYPKMLRTSTSHEEGAIRKWGVNTLGFKGNSKGEVTAIYGNFVKMENNKVVPIPGSEFEWPADLVLLAMGFVKPVKKGLLDELTSAGMELDNRGNVKASFGTHAGAFETSVPGVYACGDVRRGQSLIVWAISEGRKCAEQVHRYLMSVPKKS